MELAPDGSPVELYALLPDRGEAELVASALPPPASLLELGCGTGRITRQLLAQGYEVAAVDESAEMLARVPAAATIVQASIESLDLGRTFDLTLLASNLLSVEAARRRRFLETCRRHAPLLVVETLPLAWQPQEREAHMGNVTTRLRLDSYEGGLAAGVVEYEANGRLWTHAFEMNVFADDDELRAALAEGGFSFERWLDRDRGWFSARGH